MLDVHRLRIFRSVVTSGSVQAAAHNLGYTPSAVSQHLAALQRETGLVLLEKAGRGLEPTADGLALSAEAEALLARVGEAENLVAHLRSGRAQAISIAYIASVGSAWMPGVVKELARDFPGIALDLRITQDLPESRDDRADVHLVVHKGTPFSGPGFSAHHLIDDPYLAVMPEGHPLASRDEIDLVDLSQEDWVDNDFTHAWCRRVIVDACGAAGFSPRFVVETHDYTTANAFVAAGVGITVEPSIAATELPAGVVAIPVVRPTPQRTIHAVVRTSVEQTPHVQRTLELLRDAAKRARKSVA